MAETLHFPDGDAAKLKAHLPPANQSSTVPGDTCHGPPFVTLTFATSLDSSLSLAPGLRTAISGPQSKAMTHFLRSRHDAILVGVGTAVADDPGLNCRLGTAAKQPRPVVIDPQDRWQFSEASKVLQLTRDGLGLAPFIITGVQDPPPAKRRLLESHGGKYIFHNDAVDSTSGVGESTTRFRWEDILRLVADEGLQSIMIEGGGQIINSILGSQTSYLVDSVIITIAPTWLGQGGVVVTPPRTFDTTGNPTAAARLSDVSWHQLGDDVVLCGRLGR